MKDSILFKEARDPSRSVSLLRVENVRNQALQFSCHFSLFWWQVFALSSFSRRQCYMKFKIESDNPGRESECSLFYTKAFCMEDKPVELLSGAGEGNSTIVGVSHKWISEKDRIPLDMTNQCYVYGQHNGCAIMGSLAGLLIRESL